MQVFYLTSGRREPLAGVVGALQFDVIVGRLQTEYGVSVEVDPSSFAAARWVAEADRAAVAAAGGSATRAVDREDRLVLLFASEWELQYFERQHPEIPLLAESPVGKGTGAVDPPPSGPPAVRSARMLHLHVADPKGSRTTVVEATPFTIGRGSDNHLQLKDARVSRRHAELIRVADEWRIRDCGSRLGTMVNDTRIDRTAGSSRAIASASARRKSASPMGRPACRAECPISGR